MPSQGRLQSPLGIAISQQKENTRGPSLHKQATLFV
jgi:hypothetical protein